MSGNWREFEHVGPTLLINPLDARWGLLPTLQWVGSWLLTYSVSFSRQVERRFHICFILPWQCKLCKKPNMSFLAPLQIRIQPCERRNKWRRFGYSWWVASFHWIDLQWVGLVLFACATGKLLSMSKLLDVEFLWENQRGCYCNVCCLSLERYILSNLALRESNIC
jgi:hypothetical protein